MALPHPQTAGITSALFVIPGHFVFGILMGYYYSSEKFSPKSANKALVLVAPIIAHGVYDSLLFIMETMPCHSSILTVAFIYFFHKFWKNGHLRIVYSLVELFF